ncbi:GntR family transcriptional regulator [Nonomuraea sp. NPDC050451]|uniref:GntR family transcriptional regulator n=1 Tax=Nonomuraea sp. NPDC050451 TaxID=3364364 RepID=UPI0037A8CD82
MDPDQGLPSVVRVTDAWEFDPTSPKSEQIAAEIERRIRNGTYPPKHPIFEVRLVQEFGVARDTARKATAILRERGMIFTVRGMGSFVSDPSAWEAEPQ